jgi:hypothetical protein
MAVKKQWRYRKAGDSTDHVESGGSTDHGDSTKQYFLRPRGIRYIQRQACVRLAMHSLRLTGSEGE